VARLLVDAGGEELVRAVDPASMTSLHFAIASQMSSTLGRVTSIGEAPIKANADVVAMLKDAMREQIKAALAATQQ
jgi:hypothetical protein